MSIASISNFFRRLTQKFVRADQGNIAVIFAITLVPIIGFIGAAVDYSRANNARSAMQVALDSAALMVSKDIASGAITSSQVASQAQSYFNALYTNTDASAVTITATYTNSATAGSTILLNGSSTVATQFMKTVGFSQLGINTSSTTTWGTTKMRVAMALDNTGSMADNGKMTALQTAAKNLVDQLSALATNTGDVYISLIPFAKDVNYGSSNYNESWIDWTDWGNPPTTLSQPSSMYNLIPTYQPSTSGFANIGPGSTCPFTNNNSGFVCIKGPGASYATSTTTTIPSSGTYSGYICPGPDANQHRLYNGCWNSTNATTKTVSSCSGLNSCTCATSGSGKNSSTVCTQTSYTHTWISNAHSTWSGCFTDRTQNYDTTATAPTAANTATYFPADEYYENGELYCSSSNSPPLQPIVPLSTNWTSLKSAITAMQPTGGTNQAVGLAWAWNSLLQTDPMDAPAEDSNYTYQKAIILLSDGLNTEDRWPYYGNGSTQNGTMIDARQKLMCDNIKAAGIVIYTVQVNTSSPADPTSAVLQYCASGSSNFYLVTQASQTAAVFSSIGNSLTQLRISK
jgi:Flp pilus assembly protein TadG